MDSNKGNGDNVDNSSSRRLSLTNPSQTRLLSNLFYRFRLNVGIYDNKKYLFLGMKPNRRTLPT